MHNKLHNKLPGPEFTGETLTSSTRAAAGCQRLCAALSRRPLPGDFQQKSALCVRSDCPCHPSRTTIGRHQSTPRSGARGFWSAVAGHRFGCLDSWSAWLDTALDAWTLGSDNHKNIHTSKAVSRHRTPKRPDGGRPLLAQGRLPTPESEPLCPEGSWWAESARALVSILSAFGRGTPPIRCGGLGEQAARTTGFCPRMTASGRLWPPEPAGKKRSWQTRSDFCPPLASPSHLSDGSAAGALVTGSAGRRGYPALDALRSERSRD